MTTFDIRKEKQAEIDSIIFAETTFDYKPTEDELTPRAHMLNKAARFYDVPCIDDGQDHVLIATKHDAENLIKALQEGLRLDWWEN